MTALWKLDAALRRRRDGEVAIAVQPLATATAADVAALRGYGLAPPATPGGLWTGMLAAARLAELASLPAVGYVYDLEAASSGGVAANRPAPRPLQPAKRGHTKLPPRRR
ncbi:MAG: hypothetical protein KatS3mg060_0714 [Dehalococcoidia bacterium]|jgi:hypothetical protein|nr:MAG: hypothetical protein KatS3mg060_0714 [Dehalococcoidia bacterium]